MSIRVYPTLKSGEKLVDALLTRLSGGIRERYEAWLKRYDEVAKLYTQDTQEEWHTEYKKLTDDHLCDLLHSLDLFGFGRWPGWDECFGVSCDLEALSGILQEWYLRSGDYSSVMERVYEELRSMSREGLFSGFECC